MYAILIILATAALVALAIYSPFIFLVVFAILTLVAYKVAFPSIVKWLAAKNLFYTMVREGTAKAIMRGNTFDHFVMAFAGYHLNRPGKPGHDATQPDWEVLSNGGSHADTFADPDRTPFEKQLGVYWVGWPWEKRVYTYTFEWNETYTEHGTGYERVRVRRETTDFVFVTDFPYAVVTDGAESTDLLQMDALTFLTVGICNPYKALFACEDWMERTTAPTNQRARIYVGRRKYQQITDATSEETWADYSKPLMDLTEELPEDEGKPEPHGLKNRYGVVIRGAHLQTVQLSGAQKAKNEEAATRKYKAQQEAAETRIKAAAQAAADKKVGEARAAIIEMVGRSEAAALESRLMMLDKYKENGVTLAYLDALQEASKGGNTVVFTGLADILKNIAQGGGKS